MEHQENLEIETCIWLTDFLQRHQHNSKGKIIVFSTNGTGTTGYMYEKKKESWLPSHTIGKINLKCNLDLNIKSKIIKLLE